MTASCVSCVYVLGLHSLYLLWVQSFMGSSVEKLSNLGFRAFSPITFVAILMKITVFVFFIAVAN